MKSIPIEYHGVKFRSKLEAKWAEWLDENEIKWGYEVEGFDLDGRTWYLPDFYLPEVDTIIEVKGLMERIEKPFKLMQELTKNTKIYLKQHQKEYLLTDEEIEETSYCPDNNIMLLLAGPTPYFYNINSWYSGGLWIHQCSKCGIKSIVTDLGSYACRACGHHDGGQHDGWPGPLLAKPLEWLLLEEDKEEKEKPRLVDFLKG